MSNKKPSKFGRMWASFGSFLVLISMIIGVGSATFEQQAYAIPAADEATTEVTNSTTETTTENSTENTESVTENNAENTDTTNAESTTRTNTDTCKSSLGAIGWLVCPTTGKIAEAVDWLYDKIEDILVIQPISTEDGTPVYEIWKYCLGITNIVFMIFLLVIIYSQITGVGISNYGIKKSLPKLIIAAILVNLSFLICLLAVDVSNIVGASLRGVFTSIEESTMASSTVGSGVSYAGAYSALAGGTALSIGGVALAFEFGAIWMLIPVVLGAIVAVATGLITIALRQAVVTLLVMISPLAMVAYVLPNTEKWFKKWKDLLFKMLVFYPVFSLLFGASSLAGFAIIASAKDGFWVLLGLAVQIFPLFFSWSLMKMSGTFLGDINTRMRSLAAGPLATNRAWADSHRQATRANFLALGRTPSSHLRRFVNNRKALREAHTENLQTLRRNNANSYVQRRISGGYDGTKAQGNSAYLKPNKYTRAAKEASTSNLQSEMATMDTKHVLGNYGSYFVSKEVRDRIAAAEAAGDKIGAERIRAMDAESRRADTAGRAFLEYSRAQMTMENDDEADFNYMVGQFLDASTKYNPNPANGAIDEKAMEKYRHYIVSSAGGLGETGQTRVLGKIIARAAAVESNQRRDINIVAAKFPPDKRNFRNFLFNYYVDDDGYATDKNGNRIETMRDDLRVNHPEKLVMWDQFDENGPYFDWYDVNGNYVTRIYKKDKSAIKELMSNFDTPINDPINNLLVIHAGIEENPSSDVPVLRNMGLDGFRTTVGRALLSAPFKEKNAAFSPMVAEMVKKGYIKNYAQEYLAYLDSFNKATKPGAFNVQDADAIQMFATMMDPDEWDKIFPTELIRGFKNVNGEDIYGVRYDEDGNRVKVPAAEATRDELMERIKEKFIYPAAPKIITMMSKQTQHTMNNQKPGTAEMWKKLKAVFDEKWGEGKQVEVDPYKQKGDMREITKDIRDAIYTVDEEGNKHVFGAKENGDTSSIRRREGPTVHENYAAQIFEIFNRTLDADDYAIAVSDYCNTHREIAWIADQLQDFIVSEGYSASKEQLHEKVEELLAYVDYD